MTTGNKLYLVCASQSDCDAFHHRNLCVVRSHGRANVLVSKLNRLQDYNHSFDVRVNSEFEANYITKQLPPKPVPSECLRTAEAACRSCGAPKNRVDKKVYRGAMKTHMNNVDAWKKECARIGDELAKQKERRQWDRAQWILENYSPPDELAEVASLYKQVKEDPDAISYLSIRFWCEEISLID